MGRTRNCIFDPSKICGYPERLRTSPDPKVFVICSTQLLEIVEWFKDVFDQHIRSNNDSQFEIVFFTDLSTWDFCSNVCIPIHESWFCIAVVRNELLPQYADRRRARLVSGFTFRLNPNVFFEVGLALSTKKDVIVYLGHNQQLPTDWGNLIKWVIQEPSELLSPRGFEKMVERLEDIIRRDPFIGHHVEWTGEE